tara:strand:+ start:132 stop:1028 length:897 start_codon:yes stop_codon:yes gene_type:complete
MKIFDCFMFYDEEMVLDFRLNFLNNNIDKFIIVESVYTHSGKKRKLLFDINKYSKFKNKIKYIVIEDEPSDLYEIDGTENFDEKNSKYILNALKRENFQRNQISRGLNDALPEDFIIISDVDEIPNLEEINFKKNENKIILFNQKFFYYKFNLKLQNFDWYGSKACKMANLNSPQWLRNIKSKKYPFWRVDTFFSNTRYQNILFVKNGGWHFSNLKTPEAIERKMSTYLHHREYDLNPLGTEKIKQIINNKKAIYNLRADKKADKIGNTQDLVVVNMSELPNYIQNNIEKYKDWIETN